MIQQSSLRETYKHVYTWLGKPELFKTANKSKLELEEPRVLKCSTKREELSAIGDMANHFNASAYNTLAIICKTQKQAERVFEGISDRLDNAQLLNEQSHSFAQGIVVCTAHMAKGLEFD